MNKKARLAEKPGFFSILSFAGISVDRGSRQNLGLLSDLRHLVLPLDGHQVDAVHAGDLTQLLNLFDADPDALLSPFLIGDTLGPLDQGVRHLKKSAVKRPLRWLPFSNRGHQSGAMVVAT